MNDHPSSVPADAAIREVDVKTVVSGLILSARDIDDGSRT